MYLDPHNADAYNNRGLAYSCLKKHKRAIDDFNTAIKLNLQHTKAYLNRGNSRRALNDFMGALQDTDKAFKIDPKTAKEYLHNLEQMFIDCVSQQQYKAENNLE